MTDITLTRPDPIEHRIAANGIHFCVFEWPGDDDGRPPVLLLHATGFHARCWDQVIRQLPGRRCYALDTRGHGRTDKVMPANPWPQAGADAVAIARALRLSGAVAVGHSMGGHALTRAAAAYPEAFAALVLIDPVILPRPYYEKDVAEPEKHFTHRRRAHFASAEQMYERFKGRAPFDTWDDAVLRDYCAYGLLPAADGHGFVLACPPAVEACIYTTAELKANADIYDAVAQVKVPVQVMRCARRPTSFDDFAASPTAPDLASHYPKGEDIVLHGHTHFIPMESPRRVAKTISRVPLA